MSVRLLDSFPFERPSGLEEVIVSPLAITHYPAKRLQPPTQSSILVRGEYRLTQFVAAVFVFDTFATLLADFRIVSPAIVAVDPDLVVTMRSALPDLLPHLLIIAHISPLSSSPLHPPSHPPNLPT